MDHGTADAEFRRSGSFDKASSASSSLRRGSLSLSGTLRSRRDNDIESETVSEAGDIGDRVLHSDRISDNGSLRFSIDHALENGEIMSIPENDLFQSLGFGPHHPTARNTVSMVSPLPIISPSTKPLVYCEDQKQVSLHITVCFNFFSDRELWTGTFFFFLVSVVLVVKSTYSLFYCCNTMPVAYKFQCFCMQEKEKVLPLSLEYISCLLHLAVFGILGVIFITSISSNF